MSTDHKFDASMKQHLSTHLYDKLVRKCNSNFNLAMHQGTLLTLTSIKALPENVSEPVEQFLANLSFEEASEYVNNVDASGNSAMFYCANVGLTACLIKYVRDINVRNIRGNSALMYARSRINRVSNLGIIQLLLNYGACVNMQNDERETALMWLCHTATNESAMFEQAIELLIFSGADPFIRSARGYAAADFVQNKLLLSARSQQLLQGSIRMNNTKRAM